MFEFLLKFKLVQFEEGNLVFQAAQNLSIWILFITIVLVVLGIYLSTNRYPSKRIRLVSLILKIVGLLLLSIPLFEPVLVVPDVVSRENFIAVMADNSASMGLSDGYLGQTRFDYVRALLSDQRDGILEELNKDYMVRLYQFNRSASRVDTLTDIDMKGWETNLSASLQQVISDFKGLPLSGILLFSDGGDNSMEDVDPVARELLGTSIPLYIVGLGEEFQENDYELLEAETSQGLQEGTGAEIEIKARSWQDENQLTALDIYNGENLAFSKKVNLKGNGRIDQFSFFFDHDQKDPVEYTVQVAPASGESNLENNSLNILIDPKNDSLRVLYFQGHPLTEFKFIKRALEKDQVVDFTSISRTGTGKYYRQGIRSPDELAGGFPASEAELFRFKAVIFGDVEAGFFSLEQLSMIEKFVNKRGGGFLMIGGQGSFTEGDYRNTPIEDILPASLDPQRRLILQPDFKPPDLSMEETGFQFTPTREGLENPILKLSPDLTQNNELWLSLPNLFSIHLFGPVKPGATVLAQKPRDYLGDSEPLLIIQRYGSGRTAALATTSTWRWQMLLDPSDTRHERFWRQLVRWLGRDTPDQVNLNLTQNRYTTDVEIPLRVSVYDEHYDPLSSAEVSGIVTDPFDSTVDIRFLPELSDDGVYSSTFVPVNPGVYTIDVEAQLNGNVIGRESRHFLSRPSKKEYVDATLKKNFLVNLALTTGGRYYTPEEVSEIPSNLKTRKTVRSILTTEYAWDTPLVFLLILILLSAEWIYRRRRGLP